MDVSKLKRIVESKHLSEFSVEEMFTAFGLYETVIIDPSDIRIKKSGDGTDKEIVIVSKDVNALHMLTEKDRKILLPCAECRDDRPFLSDEYINPRRRDTTTKSARDNKILVHNVFDKVYTEKKLENSKKFSDYPPPQSMYFFGHDFLADYHAESFYVYDYDDYKHKTGLVIKDWLIRNIPEVRVDLSCTMDCSHRLCADFILEPAVVEDDKPDILKKYEEESTRRTDCGEDPEPMTDNCKEVFDLFKRASVLLTIKKIGQYPSMADMQLFDTAKYRKIMDNQSYRDLTMALGLNASGVGCGSFVYLRRIFENLAEEIHKECQELPDWDEKKYEQSRFNEKLTLMERYGKRLIPDELSEIKTKLYGVLSKGVHFSSDDECKELFPFLQFAISMILDEKIAKKERESKIKDLRKTLSAVSVK